MFNANTTCTRLWSSILTPTWNKANWLAAILLSIVDFVSISDETKGSSTSPFAWKKVQSELMNSLFVKALAKERKEGLMKLVSLSQPEADNPLTYLIYRQACLSLDAESFWFKPVEQNAEIHKQKQINTERFKEATVFARPVDVLWPSLLPPRSM